MNSLIIRPAQDHEHKAIVAVQIQGWQTAYRGIIDDNYLDNISHEDRLLRRLSYIYEKDRFSLVAEMDEQIVGMIDFGAGNFQTYGTGEIYALYVDSHHKRRGIGKQLVQKAFGMLNENDLTPTYVIALKENHPARKFYEKLGLTYLCDHISTIGGINYTEVVYGFEKMINAW